MSPMTFQHSQPTVTTWITTFADPVAPLAAGRLGGGCSRRSSISGEMSGEMSGETSSDKPKAGRLAMRWSFAGQAIVDVDRTSHAPGQREGDSNEATNRRGKHPS